jgi:tetratricopeptide (TPR) repeat protein
LIQKGNKQLDVEEYREALVTFKQGTEIAPDDVQAWYGVGLANLRLGHFKESVDALSTALTLNPDSSITIQMLTHRGMAYQGLAQVDLAADDFNDALQLGPQNGFVA